MQVRPFRRPRLRVANSVFSVSPLLHPKHADCNGIATPLIASARPSCRPLERVSRRSVAPRHHMAVDAHRGRRVFVPQPFRQGLDINAVREAPSGVRMPEDVERYGFG